MTNQLTDSSKDMELEQSSATDTDPSPIFHALQDHVSKVTFHYGRRKRKNKRQLNLILHNVIESNAEDPEERKQADIKELIKSYVGTDANIPNAMRIGKRGAKSLLLKVTVGSTKEKGSILKSCTKLCNKTIPPMYKRYTSPHT